MARDRIKTLAAVTASKSARERHQRIGRAHHNAWAARIPQRLVAIPERNIKSKHKSYFQVFENHDKKDKRLEFQVPKVSALGPPQTPNGKQVTTDKNPPPGFEFVPTGNPELTKACKELSREQEAMIFIVCAAKDANANKLALQMSRAGHHIRRTIVEEVRAQLGEEDVSTPSNSSDPEPIPENQDEINAQADAALRDLFPRIPNFDRQMIIEHAFKKGGTFQGQLVVGMVQTLPLSRRVQLAVLAHIRHNHTRYDQLLKEADYATARKVVEQHCLDLLVKWRGDEETGRDQFDEILREVVVLSDDDSDGDGDDDEEASGDSSGPNSEAPCRQSPVAGPSMAGKPQQKQRPARTTASRRLLAHKRSRPPTECASARWRQPEDSKKARRGFKRYEAVAKRWEEAVNRNRHSQNTQPVQNATQTDGVPAEDYRRLPSVEIVGHVYRDDLSRPRVTPAQQPVYFDGREQRTPFCTMDGFPDSRDARQHVPSANSPYSQAWPPEAISIGRRITRIPVDSHTQAVEAPQRIYHEELKDFLVPSIEPTCSGPNFPQSVQPVSRGAEPRGREQAPARRPELAGGDLGFYQISPAKHDEIGPAMMSRSGDDIVVPRENYYNTQPNSTNGTDYQVTRAYRIRDPVDNTRRIHANPANTANRLVRLQREARPPDSWETVPARGREYSPHMSEQSVQKERFEARRNLEPRVVYREASASRLEGYGHGLVAGSGQPLFYEIRRAPSIEVRQGRTYIQPQPALSFRPAVTTGYYDFPFRSSFQAPTRDEDDDAENRLKGRVIVPSPDTIVTDSPYSLADPQRASPIYYVRRSFSEV